MKRRNLMALVLAGVMAASVMGCASQSLSLIHIYHPTGQSGDEDVGL